MFSDSFKPIEHGAAAQILDRVNPLLHGSDFDTAAVRILSHSLSFYKGYDLIDITDTQNHPQRKICCILNQREKTIILDGTNTVIYDLNKSVPIALTHENVFIYVKFFFTYVRGRHGIFHIIDNANEIHWREEPTLKAKNALNKMISPLSLVEYQEGEFYEFKASMIFKDSLFKALITVLGDGTVHIAQQELLVEDIPVQQDILAI